MERINTEVDQIVVEIDGEEYAVAPKTVGIADQLAAARRKCDGKPEYRLWLAELEILLGKDAVKTLFVSGNDENIDRMQMIHAGVFRAFEHNADAVEAEAAERKAENMETLVRSLAPLSELLKMVQRMQANDGGVPQIRRP